MKINPKECAKQGVDKKHLTKIGKRLAKCLEEIDDLGLTVFGGSWSLSIRGDRELILATFNECGTSGGCGAAAPDNEGLMRGEGWNEG